MRCPVASQSASDHGGQAARLVCAGFHGLEPSEELAELVRVGVRSVILFARNAQDRDQVTTLIRDIKALSSEPIMVCVDQEGGGTIRFEEGFDPPPSMREIGELGSAKAAETGARLAADLRPVGIDLDLAPVVDVDSNPDNPVIGSRSFGREPNRVAECGAALVTAMQAGGVAACAKHFPGHGDTAEDSHLALPRLAHDRERLDQVELPPFRAAISADVASVMVSHVLYDAIDPSVPSTLSRRVVNDLLRQELGFEGVIVSDDLQMQAISDHYEIGRAAVEAVRAGIDLLMCCHDFDRQLACIDAIAGAMASGRIEVAEVEKSIGRLDRLYDRFVR